MTDISNAGTAATAVPKGAARPTLTEAAYRELKRRIVSVELWPGLQIREAETTASLGFGKTPVREALLRLSFEGLVTLQARSGYNVAPVTLKGARDTCQLRALLDGEAAWQAASAHGGAGDELLAIEAKINGTVAALDPDVPCEKAALAAVLDADAQFHRALARASGNDALARTLARVLDEFARLCYLAHAVRGVPVLGSAGHPELVRALADREADTARALASREAKIAEGRLLQALLSSESVASANVEPVPARNVFYLDVPRNTDDEGRTP
jgi:DNA-binding GntR family transcriptional regulator